MRILYTLRILIISFEALLLSIACLTWMQFDGELQSFAASLEPNQEALKYLMFLPVAIAAWVVNECRVLLQDDKETVRLLTLWEDYWRLKTHVWVALFYTLIFALISLLPWTVKAGIGSGGGLLLFIVSVVGQLVLASTVYSARIRVKEFLVHAEAPKSAKC